MCSYRLAVQFLWLSVIFLFNIFLCLSTYENKKPQLVLIISKLVLYTSHNCSAPWLGEENLCVSAGPSQIHAWPLPHSGAEFGAGSPISCLLCSIISSQNTCNRLEGRFGVWVQFFLIGKTSAFVEMGPNLSAGTIERNVRSGLSAS